MLYQQGTQRIEVIVRKQSGGGVSGGAGTKETDADKTTAAGGEESEGLGTGTGMNTRTKRVVSASVQHILSTVKQGADLAIDYWASGIGIQSGDQALQNRTERRIEVLKDTTSLAYSVVMGGVSMAWAGPVGIILGSALSGITSGASLLSKYSKREREYNFTIFKEQSSIEYQRARAGTDWTNGRLR